MTYCKKCVFLLDDDGRFCGNCGTPIDIQYSKGGINVERNDISESDYEAYINELKPIEWKKLP